MKRKIIELMDVPESDHDLAWLKESLQSAVELEFFTLPPYLAALWSIKADDPNASEVAESIRGHIAREEMLHMGLVCNLLVAIGETPKINTDDAVPIYPDTLPGDVNPDITVSLQGLSRKAVETFLKIEYPEGGPVAVERFASSSTIGAFYSAIQNAFERLQPVLSQERQLERPSLGLIKITSLDEVQQKIQLIKRQGEGSKMSPEDTGPNDLAHYYRFAEIYQGKKLRKDSVTGMWRFDGDPVPFPEVWPMAEIPPGGYKREDVSEEVWQLIEQVDQRYTRMLDDLQEAWKNGAISRLMASVSKMFTLQEPSQSLMQIPIPSGGGNYGPCFRLNRTP
jgi:hypothetical protein